MDRYIAGFKSSSEGGELKNKNLYKSTKDSFLGVKMMILIDCKTLIPLFLPYLTNAHESRTSSKIMLKRRSLVRFGDAIIMDREKDTSLEVNK